MQTRQSSIMNPSNYKNEKNKSSIELTDEFLAVGINKSIIKDTEYKDKETE